MSLSFCPKCGLACSPGNGRCPTCEVNVQLSGTVLIVLGLIVAVFGGMILCAEASFIGCASGIALVIVGIMRVVRQSRLLATDQDAGHSQPCADEASTTDSNPPHADDLVD